MSLLRSSHCLLPGLVLASAITHCAETTCDAISTCEDALDASTVPADVLVEARVQGNREAPSDAGDSASYEAGDVRLTDAVPDTSAVDASAEADVGASCGDAGACGCVDFRSDPHHCGACGHDCRGQACRDGMCAPVLVASEQSRPRYIAVDSDYLYWASENGDASRSAIFRAPKSAVVGSPAIDTWDAAASRDAGDSSSRGPAAATPLVQDLDTVFDVTTAAGYVYWAQYLPGRGTVLRRIPRVGGQVQDVATVGAVIYALEPDSSNMYAATSGGVYRFRLANSLDAGASVDLWSTADSATAIAIGASGAYWAQLGSSDISRIDLGGGNPRVVATATGCAATTVSVDSANLYWGCRNADNTGQELRTSLSGLDAGTTLPIGRTSQPFSMRADGLNVYWCDLGTGAILWTPANSGSTDVAPRGLAQYEDKQSCPDGFALDATNVYWTNARTGAVMRTSKP